MSRFVASSSFAIAAALAAAAFFGLYDWLGSIGEATWGPILKTTLTASASAAVVGALAGPRIARTSDVRSVVIVGIGVTVVSALLCAALVWVGLLWTDAAAGVSMSGPAAFLRRLAVVLGLAVGAGLVASPFGALASVVVWRLHRGAPVVPT